MRFATKNSAAGVRYYIHEQTEFHVRHTKKFTAAFGAAGDDRRAARSEPDILADAGAAGIHAGGRVTGLRKISDFSGNYRASGAGVTIMDGGLASHLQNERGVVIELVATDAATAANRSVHGVRVRLKNV